MANYKEIAAQLMEHLVEHDWHGYSQPNRYGDGEGTCKVTIDGKDYYLQQGDRDCSSAVIESYTVAGVDCGGASYTGNMKKCMVESGNFKWYPMSSGYIAQRGDIYLREGRHTAMCKSAEPDLLMEFSISETGGINGRTGDQTGKESRTAAYYNYPWDGILVCVKKDDTRKQVPGNAVNDFGLKYQAHVEGLGWLDPVHDGQAAGTTGNGLRMEAIRILDLAGLKIKAKAHIQGIGTVDYGYITTDTVIGTTGQSKRLEALILEVEGLPSGKKFYLQLHFDKDGWAQKVAGGSAGSFGLSKEVQAIKMWVD